MNESFIAEDWIWTCHHNLLEYQLKSIKRRNISAIITVYLFSGVLAYWTGYHSSNFNALKRLFYWFACKTGSRANSWRIAWGYIEKRDYERLYLFSFWVVDLGWPVSFQRESECSFYMAFHVFAAIFSIYTTHLTHNLNYLIVLDAIKYRSSIAYVVMPIKLIKPHGRCTIVCNRLCIGRQSVFTKFIGRWIADAKISQTET